MLTKEFIEKLTKICDKSPSLKMGGSSDSSCIVVFCNPSDHSEADPVSNEDELISGDDLLYLIRGMDDLISKVYVSSGKDKCFQYVYPRKNEVLTINLMRINDED